MVGRPLAVHLKLSRTSALERIVQGGGKSGGLELTLRVIRRIPLEAPSMLTRVAL